MPTEQPSQECPIRLEQVSYQIAGRPILRGVSLAVRRREVFGVMGRSGTGKTTLLRLLMGLIRPEGGRVVVNGVDITNLPERELNRVRADMGFVFQGAALFDSMTVFENVALGLVERRHLPAAEVAGRVQGLLEMVDVAGAAQLLPSELSGGMRKRVGMARALALAPSIMLYDEPTAGLDPIYATAINDLILNLRERTGVTSVVVTHDVTSLRRVADRAALLHEGRFLALGTMGELEQGGDPCVQQFLSGSTDGPLTG